MRLKENNPCNRLRKAPQKLFFDRPVKPFCDIVLNLNIHLHCHLGFHYISLIKNTKLFTNKINLVTTLSNSTETGSIWDPWVLSSIPESYSVSSVVQMENFASIIKGKVVYFMYVYHVSMFSPLSFSPTVNCIHVADDIWICKPAQSNRGEGIHLLRSREDVISSLPKYCNGKWLLQR